MCRVGILSSAAAIFLVGVGVPRTLDAQQLQGPYAGAGAFREQFPEVHQLLVTAESVESILLQRVVERLQGDPNVMAPMAAMDHAEPGGGQMAMAAPAGPLETAVYEELLALLREGAAGGEVPPPAAPISGEAGRRLAETLSRKHALHRRLLDIYASDAVTDKAGAVDAALEEFEGRADVSLPAVPKDMDLMYQERYSGGFRTSYAWLSGLLSSLRWIELAAFEPLIASAPEERTTAMATVEQRFWAKFDSPPERFPTELPMAPTIAPGLLLRHRPAAAALDNVNMMYELATNVLLAGSVQDKGGALERAMSRFADPQEGLTSEYEWIRMALRHGIFNQGGPAIGTLERSERNDTMSHAQHMMGGTTVMPGMPGG